jgi:NAD-specific glutamate dehydrogenase
LPGERAFGWPIPRLSGWTSDERQRRRATRYRICGTAARTELVDADARLDGWIEANRPLVERCLGILSDIRTGGTYDLTTLPVARRELRNLIQAAAAVAN